MTGLLQIVALGLVFAQFFIPKRWAFLPLLIAACHTTHYEAFGGLTTVRLVILAGLLRAATKRQIKWSASKPLDLLFGLWSAIAIISSVAHDPDFGNPLIYRCGLVLSGFGTYLYAKVYLSGEGGLGKLTRTLVFILAPLAVLMCAETVTRKNAYFLVGARHEIAFEREGRTRASGPFGTPILAGTVGALCIPLFIPFWKENRRRSALGILSCLAITVSSASSTPIGTLVIGIVAVGIWRWRARLRAIKWGTVILLFILNLIKERPIWYLIALVDFVGGSTGYHRAKLIDQSFKFLDEWWLFGTDRTSHWMPYSLPSMPGQADITNHFIFLGVVGGLGLTFLTIGLFYYSFKQVGALIRIKFHTLSSQFAWWCVGATLFTECLTGLTVAYFDNSYVFVYLLMGMVAVGTPQLEPSAESIENSIKPALRTA